MKRFSIVMGMILGLALSGPLLASESDEPVFLRVLDETPAEGSVPAYVAERIPLRFQMDLLTEDATLTARLMEGRDHRFTTTAMERRGEESFTWRGRASLGDRTSGEATITVHGQQARGTVVLEGVRYQLVSDGSRSWLDRIDPDHVPPRHPEGWTGRVPGEEPDKDSEGSHQH